MSVSAKYVPSGTRTSRPTPARPEQSRSRRSCRLARSSRREVRLVLEGVRDRRLERGAGGEGQPLLGGQHRARPARAGPVAQPTFQPVNE